MKIFNFIIRIVAVIGIAAVIYLFTVNNDINNDYNIAIEHNIMLDSIIGSNDKEIILLKDFVLDQDKIIESKNFNIASLELYIVNNAKETEKKIEELSNLSLEDVLAYILSYYETDSTEAEIIMHENGLQVIIKPRLIYEWSYTITKLESVNIELSVCKNQINEYKLMTEAFKNKISIMAQVDSLRINSMEKSEEKNTGLQKIIDNRNKKIKSITMQRNIVLGVAVIVFAIVLI